jgi:flagellin-like hook-associated protein FlgL
MKQVFNEVADTSGHIATASGVSAMATESTALQVLTIVSTAIAMLPKIAALFGSVKNLFKRK